nr:major royal jelly protein 1-like [Megalopta genalis]
MRIIVIILLAGFCSVGTGALTLQTIYEWSFLDFALPYDAELLSQIRPQNVVPTGIAVGSDRIFVSIPRLRAGVPSTLNYIPRNITGSSPQLHAYPSWDWHAAGKGYLNCSQLISVYRSVIDKCNRLWILDSGIMTSIDDFTPACTPKLLIFDLQTDQLLRMYVFPREVLRPNTLLTNMVIDDASATSCDDVFLYISDTAGPGLVVFDSARDRSWRLTHASMYPDPNFSMYRIGNDMFELMDGIVGLALSTRQGMLYFQPLATKRLFSVPTAALQAGPLPFGEQLPVIVVGSKSSQGLALAVDPHSDMVLLAPLTETIVASWNPHTNELRTLAYSPQKLQFVAEIRREDQDHGNFWIMSTSFQKFFRREVNPHTINIRLMRLVPLVVY